MGGSTIREPDGRVAACGRRTGTTRFDLSRPESAASITSSCVRRRSIIDMFRAFLAACLASFLAAILAGPIAAREVARFAATWDTADDRADLNAIARIQEEAHRHSRLMETARDLTDLYGSRLTGSPHLRAAADDVRGRLTSWGFQNARFEAWGPFGPGWTNDRFIALALSPRPY